MTSTYEPSILYIMIYYLLLTGNNKKNFTEIEGATILFFNDNTTTSTLLYFIKCLFNFTSYNNLALYKNSAAACRGNTLSMDFFVSFVTINLGKLIIVIICYIYFIYISIIYLQVIFYPHPVVKFTSN